MHTNRHTIVLDCMRFESLYTYTHITILDSTSDCGYLPHRCRHTDTQSQIHRHTDTQAHRHTHTHTHTEIYLDTHTETQRQVHMHIMTCMAMWCAAAAAPSASPLMFPHSFLPSSDSAATLVCMYMYVCVWLYVCKYVCMYPYVRVPILFCRIHSTSCTYVCICTCVSVILAHSFASLAVGAATLLYMYMYKCIYVRTVCRHSQKLNPHVRDYDSLVLSQAPSINTSLCTDILIKHAQVWYGCLRLS
jgi:hypothetical protein